MRGYLPDSFFPPFIQKFTTFDGFIQSNNISTESLSIGFDLYNFLLHCPDNQAEAKYLTRFVLTLLDEHSPSTFLQAVVNTIKSEVIQDQQNRKRFNEFFLTIEETMNLRLGPILRSKLPASDITALTNQQVPLVTNGSKENITQILKDSTIALDTMAAMVSHPVHLTSPSGQLMSSSLIPFCAYKTDMEVLGSWGSTWRSSASLSVTS